MASLQKVFLEHLRSQIEICDWLCDLCVLKQEQMRTNKVVIQILRTLGVFYYLSVATYCLTEDHVSPLLEEEALWNTAGCLLQEHKGHGSLRLLYHLYHTLL